MSSFFAHPLWSRPFRDVSVNHVFLAWKDGKLSETLKSLHLLHKELRQMNPTGDWPSSKSDRQMG